MRIPPTATTPDVAPAARSDGVRVAFAVSAATPTHAHSLPSPQLLASARDCLWNLLAPDEELTMSPDGAIVVRLHPGSRITTRHRMTAMAGSLARGRLRDGGTSTFVDVGVAWDRSRNGTARGTAALVADSRAALRERDLLPRRSRSRAVASAPRPARSRTLLQWAIVLAVTVALPLWAMIGGHLAGIPVAGTVYVVVIATILIATVLAWVETVLGLTSRAAPPPLRFTPPPATAIIAAYLPNEAATIVAILRHFLRHDYSGELQVILAYNTPVDLPVEAELRTLAHAEPRLLLLRVPDSNSKAQNVNAALGAATGEFIGVFDADHRPDPGSFERAWRWIDAGVDVVQGHCVIRDAGATLVTRTVAVEFEQIYAVAHRGRQLLHGFGVFGGSNGYWRSSVIRTIRMSPNMLTEDIDASMRAVRAGAQIINDPGLISRELAPETVSTLWRQRMRWAQGWAQVTAVHLEAVVHGDELTARQRVGLFFLLIWREAYPFLSVLMWPTLGFYLWRDGSIGFGNAPLLLLTLATLGTTPLPVLLTRLVADRSIADRRWWWWSYLLVSLAVYQEFRNTIARIAVVKLVMGERNWVVTPRGRPQPAAAPAAPIADAALPAPVLAHAPAEAPVGASLQPMPVQA